MDADHNPPPPYTETDIYSTSSSSPLQIVTPTAPESAPSAVTARTLPSAASSVDGTIYTPPYSSTSSIHQQNHGPFDDLDHVSSSSGAAYFEERPAQRQASGEPEVHKIAVTASTQPTDLPYPERFSAKDISQQDWATFVNHLLPDHTASVNHDVADRKLKAEMIDERMNLLTLSQVDHSRTDLSQINAQLDSLRQSLSPMMSTKIEGTITEWNAGFFGPRGVRIVTIDQDAELEGAAAERTPREPQMPGAWIPWEHELGSEPSNSNTTGQRNFFGGFMQAGPQGFKMGPIHASNDGFRIGRNGLRADSDGFRIGSMLVADSNGFSLGGRNGFKASNRGVGLGGRMFGRRGSQNDQEPERMHGRRHGHRGRSNSHGQHMRQRDRSASTSSESSSSSSSSLRSESSVGSLPEYDDLGDQQLPIARQSLVDWLNHPERPISKETVKGIKKEIQKAKKNDPVQFEEDLRHLKNEVKDLMRKFKEVKKTQKRQRREMKRERRHAKKALRKERRTMKQEERAARKRAGACGRRAGRASPWMDSPSHIPSMLSTPAIPTMSKAGPPFRFGRTVSAPFVQRPHPFGHFGRGGPPGMPGMSAMHGGWPSLPYVPGAMATPRDIDASPISMGADQMHTQALQMEGIAQVKETKAIELRTDASGHRIGEKEKLKKLDEASKLEEEADKYRREADRLTAEALHLDAELARELEEEHGTGQVTGVVPGSFPSSRTC